MEDPARPEAPRESFVPVPDPALPSVSGPPSVDPRVHKTWMVDRGRVLGWLAAGGCLFLVSLFRNLAGERTHLFYEGGILNLLVIGQLGPLFIKARRLALRDILDAFTLKEPVFREMYQEFVELQEHGWGPPLSGMVLAAVFLVFRITVTWDLIPYATDAGRLVVTLIGVVAVGMFTRTLWLLLAFGYLVSRMSQEFERLQETLFSWELLERAGAGYARTAIGASVVSLGLFWAVVASRGLLDSGSENLAATLYTNFFLLLLALVIPLAYLLVPIWRLHRILVHRKREIRKLFEVEFNRTEREFLEKPRREMALSYLNERQAIEEVEKLPEWPFRFESFAKVMTLVAIPAGLFFFKEIVVQVVVEILKQR